MKIFWSWQSDNSQASGRYFVRDVLAHIADELSGVEGTTEAERPDEHPVRLDHDTLDVPGSPHIAETILKKIRNSSVFVADVSPIATTPGGKRVPNPNVILELGYALSNLGSERIILVMNSAEGAKLDHLPFDLRHWRGPVTYSLHKDASDETRQRVFIDLKEQLRARIMPSLLAAAGARIRELEEQQRGPKITVRSAHIGPVKKENDEEAGVRTLAEIKVATPLIGEVSAQPVTQRSILLTPAWSELFSDPLSRWTPEQIQTYNNEVESYYGAYATYLVEQGEYDALFKHSYELCFDIHNDGTLPATGMTVSLSFPDAIGIFRLEGYDEDVLFPPPPERPRPPSRDRLGLGSHLWRGLSASSRPILPIGVFDELEIFRDQQRIEYSVRELMHHDKTDTGRFIITLPEVAQPAEINVDYTIRARELPQPVTGRFAVKLPRFDG